MCKRTKMSELKTQERHVAESKVKVTESKVKVNAEEREEFNTRLDAKHQDVSGLSSCSMEILK